jgi:hypothetical protein
MMGIEVHQDGSGFSFFAFSMASTPFCLGH